MSLLRFVTVTKTRSRDRQEESVEVINESRDKAAAGPSRYTVGSVAADTDVSVTVAPKLKTARKFNKKWLEEFSWCVLSDGKMICTVCTRASKAYNAFGRRLQHNNFVKGSTNFQRSALLRHQDGLEHRDATSMMVQKQTMEVFQGQLSEAASDSVTAQIRTALMMATEDLPDTKFVPLLTLQKANGVPALQAKQQWYTGHGACKGMQDAVAEVCQDHITKRLKESPFLGIMLDESLDIAVQKKLVIYFKLVVQGVPCVQFGINCEVPNGKAATIVEALRKYLATIGVPLGKIIGIGTDGAATMLGCNNGVVTILRRSVPHMISVWCCAHRLSLVCHWAGQKVLALTQVEATLVLIFKYFKYSAVRYNKVKEMKRIMNDKVKRFKRPTAVRWLSLHDAVTAAEEGWGSLVLTLEHETASGEGDTAKAMSLLKDVKTYKFIAMLCLLRDVLEPLTKCSKSFQKDTIDIAETNSMLNTTFDVISTLPDHPGTHITRLHTSIETQHQYQNIPFGITERMKRETKATCTSFVTHLQAECDRRFPDEDMSVLKALDKTLNPQNLPMGEDAIVAYGEEQLETLLEAFPQLDEGTTRSDHRMFKFMLHNNRQNNLQQMCTKILNSHAEQFPDFATLANISLVLPLTSVPCERAFSVQNSVMSTKRSCMSNESLNNKMLILSESRTRAGDKLSTEDMTTAATAKFTAAKRRKISK